MKWRSFIVIDVYTGKVEKFTAHVNCNLHYVNLSLHVLKILIYKVSTCKT